MNYEEKIRETLEQKIAQLKIVEQYLDNCIPVKNKSNRTREYEKREIEIKAQIFILRFLLSEN